MKGVIAFFCFFLFIFSISSFSSELSLKEDKGFLNIKISLSEKEIESLLQGKEIDKFSYFLEPNNPALTYYAFYLALPDDKNLKFSYIENSEERKGKIPLLDENGNLKYENYELSDEWFPKESARILKDGFIRQVPFKIIHFYPIQISKNGIKINKEIEIKINYDSRNCKKIIENDVFSRLYDDIFLNEWRDKGVEIKKNLRNNLWAIPPSDYTIYKIPIEKDGIYKLDYNFLDLNTDWNLSVIDPRKIHLYNLGQEIPIYISGEGDGHFDTNDVLYFYGEIYKDENLEGVWQKGDFTDKNIYWLVIEDAQGLRMAEKDVSPVNNFSLVQNYAFKEKFEQNLEERGFVPYQDSDHWVWDYIRWMPYDQTHTIGHFYLFLPSISNTTYNCTLKYEIRGLSWRSQNPDHHIKIKINGQEVDEFYFDDHYFYQREVNFPQSYLGTGNQTIDLTVEVQNPSEIGIDGDGVGPNWFEITYKRDFISNNDFLSFNLNPGNQRVQISNFSSNDIILMDITNPKVPLFCINGQISNGILTFEESISSLKYYRAEVPFSPSLLIPYSPINLLSENPEYLAIAPKSWISSSVLDDYLNFRQNQGLTVKKVAVEDIYDQFNFGIFSPFAIKDFLQNLYNLSNPPNLTYVLLIGDAEYDYKDYRADGNLNFVPTYMRSSTGHGDYYNPFPYYSYENFFVNFLGEDNLPEVLLGRISSKTQAEMEATLNKIKLFETDLPDKTYLKNFLHIAGCRDGDWFEGAQEINKSYAETPYFIENMYLRLPPYNPLNDCNSPDYDIDNNEKKDSVDRFNSGEGIVSFIGHGSMNIWDDRGVLQNFAPSDIPLLTNSSKPSIVLNSNCFTGSFYHSNTTTTILEDLINRQTGAASAFGPGTYMAINIINIPIKPIYENFFGPQKERCIGVLYFSSFSALETLGNDRLTQGFVHLGDPATIYPVQTPQAPLNLSVQNPDCRNILISWQPPDGNPYLYNIYRSEEENANYTKILSNYNDTSYKDTDLVYGKTYYYRVSAVDKDGFEGRWASAKSVYVNPCPPLPPQNFTCSDSTYGGRIKYNWDLSQEPEVINYRIYYGFSSGNLPYFKDTGNVSSYEIGGFTDGAPIFSKISAFNYFDLESNKSNQISCTPTHTNGWRAPKMVYPLTLTKDGNNPVLHFNLPDQNIWGDPITKSNLQLCTIYRSESPNFNPNRSSTSPDKIGTVLPSSCSSGNCAFTDNNSPQNAFYYVTCQTPQKEESSISINPPLYITNLEIIYGYSGEANLSWEPVSKKIDGTLAQILYYEIYKGTTPNFLPDFKDKTNRVGISYTTEFADPMGIGYYYKVIAVDTKGNGGPY